MIDYLVVVKLFFAFTIRYFVLAGIPFLLFYKLFTSNFVKNKIQKQTAKRKDFLREIGYSMLTNLVFLSMSLFLLYGPVKEISFMYENINDYPLWYAGLSFILALLIHDTYFYWMHRVMHIEPIYKALHKTHHLSTNPSPFASFAFHLGEAFFESLIIIVVVFLIPIHPYVIIAFTLASLLINVYGHLGYEIMPQWFGKSFLFKIINTSVHHNMHHQYFKGNYGLYFRFWDRIMGTENPNYVESFNKVQLAKKNHQNN